MEWIVSSSRDITPNKEQLMARHAYIETVTGTDVTLWEEVFIQNMRFFRCFSFDDQNGSFITAHIDDIIRLSRMQVRNNMAFVVANTCVWIHGADKAVLKNLQANNRQVRLWFAKQELSLSGEPCQLRESNLLSMVGKFGFLTSKSERILFANRRLGFEQALDKAFEPVSPVLLPKDFCGFEWKV